METNPMTLQLGPFTPTLSHTLQIFGYGIGAMCAFGPGTVGSLAGLADRLNANRHPRSGLSTIEIVAMHSFLALGAAFVAIAAAMRGVALLSAAITCSVSPSMIQLFEGAKTLYNLAPIPLLFASIIGVLS